MHFVGDNVNLHWHVIIKNKTHPTTDKTRHFHFKILQVKSFISSAACVVFFLSMLLLLSCHGLSCCIKIAFISRYIVIIDFSMIIIQRMVFSTNLARLFGSKYWFTLPKASAIKNLKLFLFKLWVSTISPSFISLPSDFVLLVSQYFKVSQQTKPFVWKRQTPNGQIYVCLFPDGFPNQLPFTCKLRYF